MMAAPIPFGLTTPRAGIAYDLAQARMLIAQLQRDVARLRAELAQLRPAALQAPGADLFDLVMRP